MTLSRLSENLAVGAALTLVYLVAGKLGLMLAFVHASATAVWPPTGIALVSLLMLGPRVWPEHQQGDQGDARRRPHGRRARMHKGEHQPELPGDEIDEGERRADGQVLGES